METIIKTDQLVELLKRRLAIWDAMDSLDSGIWNVLANSVEIELTPQIRKLYNP